MALDFNRDLVPSFIVLDREFNLEYEGLHLNCFKYRKYGHKEDRCPHMLVPIGENKEKEKTKIENKVDPVEVMCALMTKMLELMSHMRDM